VHNSFQNLINQGRSSEPHTAQCRWSYWPITCKPAYQTKTSISVDITIMRPANLSPSSPVTEKIQNSKRKKTQQDLGTTTKTLKNDSRRSLPGSGSSWGRGRVDNGARRHRDGARQRHSSGRARALCIMVSRLPNNAAELAVKRCIPKNLKSTPSTKYAHLSLWNLKNLRIMSDFIYAVLRVFTARLGTCSFCVFPTRVDVHFWGMV
jgi:hypothetical protein